MLGRECIKENGGIKLTEYKRFVCYFDNIVKKWCVQDTDSLDMHYVADEPMGEEFAHLLNLYQQTLDNVEKENDQLKKENNELKGNIINSLKKSRTVKCNCNPCVAEETVIEMLMESKK